MANLQISTADLWPVWRRLYPVYSSLARESVIETEPCADLEGINTPAAEAVAEARKWFAAMDGRIQIHHLRHFAQTSPLMTEQAIADLLLHILGKDQRTAEDRDKVDFLLVQLIAMRLPPKVARTDLTLDSAMNLLKPACSAGGDPPKFAADLDQLITDADRAKNLNTLFTSRIIERSHEIKQACGADFFQPTAMAAFARFGYLIRRRFFQLMHQDLNAIFDGLRELETRGVATIDCRRAQFSAEEPVTRIRMICQSWRVMFQAEYSSGQPLCLLVDLRTAVESALAQTAKSLTAVTPLSTVAAPAIAKGMAHTGR